MSVLKDLINANNSLSQGISKVSAKAKVKADGKFARIAWGSYAVLRDQDSKHIQALDRAEKEIRKSGDEALIAEWESLVHELNVVSEDFFKKYLEGSGSLLQRLAKLAK